MPISWNEIKHLAMDFSREWEGEKRERSESQSFWNAFFNIFGINRRRVASFEDPVKNLDDNYSFIDLFWKGMLLVEHKSEGENLDKAYSQGLSYFNGLKEHELPKYVLVSDFARFRLYDLDDNKQYEFKLAELHKNVNLFGFIAGYTQKKYKEEAPVNIKAAEQMGKLHDELLESGYRGHELEVLLMRLLFCMFADDTGIFDKNIFTDYIRDKTNADGSDIGGHLTSIFQTVNTKIEDRQRNIDESLNDFPYVNGGLFEENLRTVYFNSNMRGVLLGCCDFDWSNISPAIFGSMFQSVMNPKQRREIGAHYTTEKNILKLIEPLFLDELRAEFKHIKNLKSGKNKRFTEFHKKLANLKFFDPACGCGNFLVVTYRELRRLEIEILKEIHPDQMSMGDWVSLVSVEQFYGIEIEEFPARIAETAMWLIDHQMNVELSVAVDLQRPSLPLVKSAHILIDNALQVDWEEFAPKEEIDYILGNPPFIGHHLQSAKQKKEQHEIWGGNSSAGVMDYVTNWYLKAATYIQGTQKKVAFVSTNSITMGEQAGILWKELFERYNIKIHFAHRTFSWSSEAKGKAAVHVVIIGFAAFDTDEKTIFEYEDIKGEPHQTETDNINQYLLDAPDVVISNRSKPVCDVPAMKYGSKPTDGGIFLFTNEEKKTFIEKEPQSAEVVKPFLSAREFLNNKKRWCLWLVGISPVKLKTMPEVMKRVERVRKFRAESKAKSTRDYPYHTLFRQVTQPDSNYILIPRHSSENRKYIPFGFFSKDWIVSDSCLAIPNATLYHFGVLTSQMHMAWIKYTCGRLKSDFRYSKDIVYNNYPWPKNVSEKNKAAVEAASQGVLDARLKYPDSSLADLYDPLAMPPDLVKAHNALDKAVDKCYRGEAFTSEIERLEYLFMLYNQYTEPLIVNKKTKKRRRSKRV
jgi:hypothetical protein